MMTAIGWPCRLQVAAWASCVCCRTPFLGSKHRAGAENYHIESRAGARETTSNNLCESFRESCPIEDPQLYCVFSRSHSRAKRSEQCPPPSPRPSLHLACRLLCNRIGTWQTRSLVQEKKLCWSGASLKEASDLLQHCTEKSSYQRDAKFAQGCAHVHPESALMTLQSGALRTVRSWGEEGMLWASWNAGGM